MSLVTLIVPSLIAAWAVLLASDATGLTVSAGRALVPLWVVMIGALAVRAVEGWAVRRRRGGPSPLAHTDVLTSTGRAMAWLGAAALVAAAFTGWASLAVVGVLGLAVVYVTVTWTALVAGGDDPWRGARVERSIAPALAVEGDTLREEIRVSGVRVPPGFTLFVRGESGRTGDRRVSRYAVGSEASRAEVQLAGELGPARRGEHDLAPLSLWLGDVFGICRTPIARLGAATHTVLPRPGAVDGARRLLGRGGDDAEAVPAQKLPTEGWFRLREYAPGDDTRRIHWLRSAASRQLVVRLPDEIPPAEPAVRLVLDDYLLGVDRFACRSPEDLLDALVRVWLGVGRALADQGVRVNLVTAIRRGERVVSVERPLRPRALEEGLRLGARVRWQGEQPLAELARGGGKARTVVVTSRPRPVADADEVLWIVVPEATWTAPEPVLEKGSPVFLPFPSGSAENRPLRRLRAVNENDTVRRDGAMFDDLMASTDWDALASAFVARPSGSRVALEVVR